MALPKETLDRIEKDADAAASKVNDTYRERETQFTNRISFLAGYKEGYIAGATAEAERAQKLVEALGEIAAGNCDYEDIGYVKQVHSPECKACRAKEALQQWKEGKVVEKEKEPLIPIAVYKQQGCNVSNSRRCPHCGKELSRDRNLCCRECGEEVSNELP